MKKEIKHIIAKAQEDEEILAVALFGSYARNEPYKDVDICIFLNKNLSNLEMANKQLNYLKELPDKFDVQIFQQLPIYIRIRILKEGKILLSKNENSLYEIAFSTIKEFSLYEKLYKMYLEEVKNGPRKNSVKI